MCQCIVKIKDTWGCNLATWEVSMALYKCLWSEQCIGNAFFIRCQFSPSGIVVACVCVCMCVCVSVCLSACQSLVCPCDNSEPVHARVTKFGPKCKRPWSRSLLLCGLDDLEIWLKSNIFRFYPTGNTQPPYNHQRAISTYTVSWAWLFHGLHPLHMLICLDCLMVPTVSQSQHVTRILV